MVTEDFVRGGEATPVPLATGGLPGGVASMPFVWSGMASETHTHSREELKIKSAGDPTSLVVSYKEECCITSVSRAMYAALQVARRHLPPNCWSWQLLCLPTTARRSARKTVNSRCWELSSGP